MTFRSNIISLPLCVSISIIINKCSVCIEEHSTTVTAMVLTFFFYQAPDIPSIFRNEKIGDSENGSLAIWISLQSLIWTIEHQTASGLSNTLSSKTGFCSFTRILLASHWHQICDGVPTLKVCQNCFNKAKYKSSAFLLSVPTSHPQNFSFIMILHSHSPQPSL